MNWVNKKVLVTGAGGFIGSHLCEALLDKGCEITAMVRYNSRNDWGNLELLPVEKKTALKIAAGNIEDNNFVEAHARGKDVVFHLAALIGIPYSYAAPLSYVRTNIEGTLNIMEAARKYGIGRIVHTSTSETYGTAIYTPIDEKHPLQGQSPYSATKIGADKIAESYHLSFDLPVTTIRPFNVYGPRQSARAVVPAVIIQALTRRDIRLGSPAPIRDLTYVKDTVSAFLKAAESEQAIGKTINIGSGLGIAVGELAATILTLMGCDKPVVPDKDRLRPCRSEVYNLICDNSKAKKLLGWEPRFSLKEGLKETIEFIMKNKNLYKPEIYNI